MNLFDLFVKIAVDDQASGAISKLAQGLGNGLKTAAKIGTAAVTAAAAGITKLTSASVKNYAEYEQLVGGVETLFGAGGKSVEEYAQSVGKSVEEARGEYDKLMASQQKVLDYAAGAYKTAGLSANEYMSTVTSFSASLLQSLRGDTEAAAEYANQALTDMSDNANKMGTDMSLIQSAYQGFAKQNYTMLDNLKLGYGGTQEEMKRLISDASKLDKSVKANDMSFGNIVKAIHAVQTEMGITGTTAKEAASTISGSVGMMKAAWSNLVTGIADNNADFDTLIDNLVESVGTVADNILPRVEVALGGIASLIDKLGPIIIERLPVLVETVVPVLLSAATSMVNSVVAILPSLIETVVTALIENAPLLIDAAINLISTLIQSMNNNKELLIEGAINIITQLVYGMLNMLPMLAHVAVDIILALAQGIAENVDLPEFGAAIVEVITQLVNILTDPEMLTSLLDAAIIILESLAVAIIDNLPLLIDAAISLINNLVDFILDPENLENLLKMAVRVIKQIADGLVAAIPQLTDAAISLILKLIDFIIDPENIKMLIDMAFQIVTEIVGGLIRAKGKLVEGALKLIGGLWDTIIETDWWSLGEDIIGGLWDGLKSMWTKLEKWFSEAWDGLVGGIKDLLGIHSPSRVFAGIGKNMALGVGEGFDDTMGTVEREISGNFNRLISGIDTDLRFSYGTYGSTSSTSKRWGGVSITQNIYSQAQTAADLMEEAQYEAERAVLMGV